MNMDQGLTLELGGYALRNTLINHQFQTEIKNAKGTSCPYCSVPPKKIGYGNDLKTNYPELAKEWDYEKNNKGPEEYFPSSNKRFGGNVEKITSIVQ